MMRLAEGHAGQHQPIHQIGGEQVGILHGLSAGAGVHLGVAQHGGEDVDRGAYGVHRVKEAFLVLLHVAVVGERQALEGGEQGNEVANYATGLAAG